MKLKIKELRIKKNLTQDELCALSGIKKRSLLDYESGKTDVPFSKLHNIATSLQVSVYDLIDDDDLLILNESKENYGKTENTDIAALKKNNELLKEQTILQEEIIIMLREKLKFTEEKYNDCENQKKILANCKKMD